MKKGYSSLSCGLIGEHLSHSFSAPIHALLADYPYEICELTPDEVGDFVKFGKLDAFNVTIPYKETVIPYLDFLSPEAERIGSVNTVVRQKDGRIAGYNTDYFGFDYMLASSGVPVLGKKAVVLGTGGASKTVRAVLRDRGVRELIVVGRSSENNYENLFLHYDADLIVNTTPVGMYPNNGVSPVKLSHFKQCQGVLDLIYNPQKTALLLEAEELGIPYINGLRMLVAQAVKAFEFFTGDPAEEGIIETVTKALETDKRNLVLIGMPACGKSTVGRLSAARMGRTFFDSDEEFCRMHGLTPADAIETLGEERFRQLEHETIVQLGKQSGAVIATGGGVVTRPENYAPLHQNGVIVYLWRDPSTLSSEGRPLSKKLSPRALYEQRRALYERFADHRVESAETPEETVCRVAEAISTEKRKESSV